MDIEQIIRDHKEDTLNWIPDLHGIFSMSLAYEEIRNRGAVQTWHPQLWDNFVHPKIARTEWELIINYATTNDNMKIREMKIVS